MSPARTSRALLVLTACLAASAPLASLPAEAPSGGEPRLRVSLAHVTQTPRGGGSLIELTVHSSRLATITSVTIPGAASSGLFVDGNMCDGEDIAVRLAGVVVPAGATVSFGTRVEEAVAFGMPRHLRLHSRVTVEVTTVIDGSTGVTSIQGKVVHRPPGLTLPTP